MLRRAIELGVDHVDHVDTAQYRGPDVANALIREALQPYPESLVLVSRVGTRRDSHGGWLAYDLPDELSPGIKDNLASRCVDRLGAVNLRHVEGCVRHPVTLPRDPPRAPGQRR